MSLEQQNDFVILRRILRAVCPEYVIYTKSDMQPGQAFLDPDRQTIVLSDHTEVNMAIAAALFQIGKLKISIRFPSEALQGEQYDRALASALNRHDHQAIAWAFSTCMAFWPGNDPDEMRRYLKSYVMSSFDWFKFLKN